MEARLIGHTFRVEAHRDRQRASPFGELPSGWKHVATDVYAVHMRARGQIDHKIEIVA
jgi:hypothetical protein